MPRLGILLSEPCCRSLVRLDEPTVFLGRNAIRTSVLVLLGASLFAQSSSSDSAVRFHSMIPLGAEAFELQGAKWKGIVTLLGSAENPQFEGMVRREIKQRVAVFSADGERMKTYPERVSFRITASYRTRMVDASPFPISTTDEANDYLLHLRFRIVIFDGLRQTVLRPESVEMIGMPSEVPYDERIYRVAVDLANIPLTDRVVLEVRDPDGERICKFHLDLM